MSEINNNPPVVVTGEERGHPALRLLARACIALARLRLEQQATGQSASEEKKQSGATASEREEQPNA